MAIESIESFANLATADLALKYAISGTPSIDATSGRWGGPCLRLNNSNQYLEVAIAAAQTVGQAVAVKLASLASASVFEFLEGATLHTDIRILADGTIRATRNGTTLGTSTLSLLTGLWYHIEAKVKIDNTTGTVDVLVNGVNWLSLTGQDTQNAGTATATRIRLGCPVTAANNLSDWVTWSLTTGPVGDCRVGAKLPSGAGTNTQMTASAGSNYQCVDEANQNGDTDYVSETTAGERDTYAFTALGLTGTVKAVQVNVWARKDDAGSRTLAPVIRQGGVNYDGTALAVLDSYAATCKQVYATDPNTAAAWTVSGVDSAEYGQKLVS